MVEDEEPGARQDAVEELEDDIEKKMDEYDRDYKSYVCPGARKLLPWNKPIQIEDKILTQNHWPGRHEDFYFSTNGWSNHQKTKVISVKDGIFYFKVDKKYYRLPLKIGHSNWSEVAPFPVRVGAQLRKKAVPKNGQKLTGVAAVTCSAVYANASGPENIKRGKKNLTKYQLSLLTLMLICGGSSGYQYQDVDTRHGALHSHDHDEDTVVTTTTINPSGPSARLTQDQDVAT